MRLIWRWTMSKWFTIVVLAVLILNFSVTGYSQEIDLSTLLENVQAPVFLQSSGQTYLPGAAGEQRDGKPPLSVMRIAGESLLGEVGGLVGIFPALITYYSLVGDEDNASAAREDMAAIVAYFGVLPLFCATGVYMVGSMGNERGSFLAAMSGAAAGWGVNIIIGAIKEACHTGEAEWESSEDGSEFLDFIVLGSLPTIGAIIGFNMTRRYHSPSAQSETALINCRDGKMSLAVPRVYFRTDPFGRGNLSQRVDLLRVRF
jgi:hypothetical protein